MDSHLGGVERSPEFEGGANSSINETDSSLDFALDCGYITPQLHQELVEMNRSVVRMLGSMLKNPSPFLLADR